MHAGESLVSRRVVTLHFHSQGTRKDTQTGNAGHFGKWGVVRPLEPGTQNDTRKTGSAGKKGKRKRKEKRKRKGKTQGSALGKVGRRAALEPISAALATHRLLPDARDHLRDVDRRALGPAGRHDECRVVVVERAHAHVARHGANAVEHILHARLQHTRALFYNS